MTNLLDILRAHRSIRKYKSDPIPDNLLLQILDSARQAPSSSNLQVYSIIVVKDQEKKKLLAEYCGNQPWIEQCPVFLAMCPDLHRLNRICALRGYKFSDRYLEIALVAMVDTSLVAQNIAVGAEANGLGICMIGGIRNNPDKVAELLKLPDRVFPLMGICLGYPDHDPMIKPRLQPDVIIHSGEYNDDNLVERLQEYDEVIRATGLYKGTRRKVPSPSDKEVPDEEYSWTEHTARRAASTNPAVLRTHLRKFLEDREIGLE
jgi:nitroreductase